SDVQRRGAVRAARLEDAGTDSGGGGTLDGISLVKRGQLGLRIHPARRLASERGGPGEQEPPGDLAPSVKADTRRFDTRQTPTRLLGASRRCVVRARRANDPVPRLDMDIAVLIATRQDHGLLEADVTMMGIPTVWRIVREIQLS